jgi:hypothetical protein
MQILKADEGAIEVLWKQRCSSSTYFVAAGLVLMQTYEWLSDLAGCGELLWAGHFLGLLSLGGHALDRHKFMIDRCAYVSQAIILCVAQVSLLFLLSCVAADRDVALQGA